MGTINSLASYLQSELNSALPNVGLPANTAASVPSGVGATSAATQTDNQQLSPFAQLMSELQQLQRSDPTKYQQVTGQIATNLQNAAQTAQTDGNSTAANQLNQLAADFASASQSGQLPNIQDLAQATGAHHHGHHHHHSHAASEDPNATSSTDGTSTSNDAWTNNSNQGLSQLLSSYQANGSPNGSLDPTTIILSTLSSAGANSSQ